MGPFDFTPAPGQFVNVPPAPQQGGGGMFGGGKFGIGQALVAALNGYLASTRGPSQELGAQNLQMMAAMRQRQMERQQTIDDYNRRRGDENADYVTHLQQKAQYDTQPPDEMTRHMDAAGVDPNSPEGKSLYAASLDPVVMTPYGPMTRSQVLKMGGGGQPAAPGVTFTPIPPGGQTPPASGNFPH